MRDSEIVEPRSNSRIVLSEIRKFGFIGLCVSLSLAGCGGSIDESAVSAPSGKTVDRAVKPVVAESSVTNPENATLEGLVEPIRKGEAAALAAAFKRSMAMPNRPEVAPPAPTTSEIGSWKRIILACSESIDKFEPDARKVIMRLAGRMLILSARDQVAVNWSDLLDPVRAVLAKGTSDSDCEVRAAAIDQIAVIWDWVPGRDIFTVERNTLAAWKGGMLQLVQPHLKDAEIPSRLAAMRCLAALPIDSAAEPAVELIADKEPFVRAEVIRHFALRNSLIPEEQLLTLIQDEEAIVSRSAELALKARGLSDEQISLGRAILDKDPLIRISVIEKLNESMDIDPGVWLARLVEDQDAAVRLKAIEAIANRKVSRELLRRLQVISEKDTSDAVRKSAEKVLRSNSTAFAETALPPLPGQTGKETSSAGSASTLRAN